MKNILYLKCKFFCRWISKEAIKIFKGTLIPIIRNVIMLLTEGNRKLSTERQITVLPAYTAGYFKTCIL